MHPPKSERQLEFFWGDPRPRIVVKIRRPIGNRWRGRDDTGVGAFSFFETSVDFRIAHRAVVDEHLGNAPRVSMLLVRIVIGTNCVETGGRIIDLTALNR